MSLRPKASDAEADLYQNFGRLLAALAERAALQQSARSVPVVMVLDTFEEVVYRTNEDLKSIWRALEMVQREFPALRVVISGRTEPRRFEIAGRSPQMLPLEELSEPDAIVLLDRLGVEPAEIRVSIVRQVGRSPLTLRLAARAAKSVPVNARGFEGLSSRRGFFRDVAPEVIRGELYRRILGHIHDEDVRVLAHPGMALRRVTPELIEKVLAPTCGLKDVGSARAKDLFEDLRLEHALVRLEEDRSLRYREEVRTPMLALLAADKPELVRNLHSAAIGYYKRHSRIDPLERAEELYHRMMLNEGGDKLERRWVEGVDRYLASSLDEIPDAQKIWLAGHMSIELAPEVYARAEIVEWERLIGGKALEASRYSNPAEVLALLSARGERSSESPLYSIEIRARMSLGEFDLAVAISQRAAKGWSMHNEGRLAEILWLGAQAARLADRNDLAQQFFLELLELTARLSNKLPRVQVLTELVAFSTPEQTTAMRVLLAEALDMLGEEDVYAERALVRLACVRLGADFPRSVRRVLVSAVSDVYWDIEDDQAGLAVALAKATTKLGCSKDPVIQGVVRNLVETARPTEQYASVFSILCSMLPNSAAPELLEALLIMMSAEKADLGAASLAGLDDYRESFERRASPEATA